MLHVWVHYPGTIRRYLVLNVSTPFFYGGHAALKVIAILYAHLIEGYLAS